MRVCILIGSNRQRSNSAKIGGYIAAQLAAQQPQLEVDRIDLASCVLPLWTEDAWSETSETAQLWARCAQRLRVADGLVVVAPEWNGSTAPALKNFFMFCSAAELAHKPGLLVAVSATLGGAYPIAELRMSAYKNNRLCFIPEHVIVRRASEVLLEAAPASEHDAEVRSRIQNGLDVFLAYTESLSEMRRKHGFDFSRHPYGM